MTWTRIMALAAIILCAPVYAIAADAGFMRINYIEGDLQIRTPDSGEWGYASINGPLGEGDQVWTSQGSRAELQLNDGSYVRLDENTSLQVLSMEEDSSQFYVSQGRAYVYYKAPGEGVIQMDSPDASVRAFVRSNFGIDITDGYTDVSVFKGEVNAENNSGTMIINAGEMASLERNGYLESSLIGQPDEWEEWNRQRNRGVIAYNGAASGYLPPEIRLYSSDFDANGRWVRVAEYGHVWMPTVDVGPEWAPYRNGRWIWRGGEYIWVGFETWGWAPYHYGRWTFTNSYGWCWVPPAANDVYWSPGYVGWFRTPEYVAWVPLAPGEMYYGRGNYGRFSVNIAKPGIERRHYAEIYRNGQIGNAVTVVRGNSFNTASPVAVKLDRNMMREKIFVRGNYSFGAPGIKPERASFFARPGQVPPAKLPPVPVRNLGQNELKRARPFIRDANRPVFHPGANVRSPEAIKEDRPEIPGRGIHRRRNVNPQPGAGGGPTVIPTPQVEKEQRQPRGRVLPGLQLPPSGNAQTPPSVIQPQRTPVRPETPLQKQQPLNFGKGRAETPARPAGERPRVAPSENRQPATTPVPAVKNRQPQIYPQDRRKIESILPGGEIRQRENMERRRGPVPGGAVQPVERPGFQQGVGGQQVAPAAPAPRSVIPQAKDLNRIRKEQVVTPPPKAGNRQVQPQDKGDRGERNYPGERREKKQEDPAEGNRRLQ